MTWEKFIEFIIKLCEAILEGDYRRVGVTPRG